MAKRLNPYSNSEPYNNIAIGRPCWRLSFLPPPSEFYHEIVSAHDSTGRLQNIYSLDMGPKVTIFLYQTRILWTVFLLH
jgi:hypothetical protein